MLNKIIEKVSNLCWCLRLSRKIRIKDPSFNFVGDKQHIYLHLHGVLSVVSSTRIPSFSQMAGSVKVGGE